MGAGLEFRNATSFQISESTSHCTTPNFNISQLQKDIDNQYTMSDRCAGCTNKYKFFEKPTLCPQCQRSFCNLCLPPPKKGRKSGAQIAQDTCVYCSRKHQQVKESEEKEILETFQERFYKHSHTEPPIQTRVQLDFSKQPKPSEKTAVALTEEDKALIERHRKLKESRRAGEGSFDEDNVRDRLAKLRGESEQKTSNGQAGADDAGMGSGGGGVNTGSGGGEQGKGTQVEQASDLIEQMKDEVRIEGKLEEFNQERDEELHQRFLALKGKTAESSPSQLRQSKPPNMTEIQNFLEGMEVQVITDEDPENLLQDLRAFQSREEKQALSESQSGDILALVDKARELAKEEGQPLPEDGGKNITSGASANIYYPPILDLGPGSASATDESKGHSNDVQPPEVTNLMRDMAEEVEQDEVRRKEDLEFTAGAAERLSKLRSQAKEDTIGGESRQIPNFDDIAEDEEVRSKLPTMKGSRKSLDFTWSHFGGSEWSHPDKPPSTAVSGLSAARQLGLELSGNYEEEREEDLSDEVQALMKEVMAEAELDSKLERTGLGHYLDTTTKKDDDNSGAAKSAVSAVKPDSQGGASVGATAANYWSGAVGGRSYGFGDNEDLPWCCICNEDATIQCFDCDGDLYCTQCFSEGHEQFGLFDHKYGPFEPPRKAI